jgi:predicted negative regulator of RcsB-dependent stress response
MAAHALAPSTSFVINTNYGFAAGMIGISSLRKRRPTERLRARIMDQTVAELPVLDRALTWFQVNQKQIIWGTTAVVVVGLAVGFYQWKKHDTENSASAALSAVEAQRVLPGGTRNESAEAYLKVASEHAGTKAAARALLLAGGAYFVQGSYTEAQAQFQKFLTLHPDSPLRGQASLGVAACLDALGRQDEAAVAYKSVVDRHAGDPVQPPAKFALARIYEAQGKLDQAARLYDEIMRETGGSMGNEAGLKAGELRAKLPAPAPVTASPAVPALIPTPSNPSVVSTNAP